MNHRPLLARIDAAALAHNLMVARRAAGRARVLAVVKANAYGHGLLRAAAALRAADGFAVLTLNDAATLRGAGYTHPIVLLEGFFHPDELAEIVRLRLRPVIHREDQARVLCNARLEHKLDILLKVDTGMHRLGLAPRRVRDTLVDLRAARHVGKIVLMTHFACADDPAVGVEAQLNRFTELTAELDLHAPESPFAGMSLSLANSAALLRYPETQGDWVRPGIMLYGASPYADETGEELGLLPVMSLHSQLIAVQTLRRGEAVGYGATFVAERDIKVGVVACGYADGYPRHAPTGTPVLVEGQRTRVVGRVSMDMLSVDLGPVPHAHVGSPVTLWGVGLPVEEVAAAAGTISYELLCALAPRVQVEDV